MTRWIVAVPLCLVSAVAVADVPRYDPFATSHPPANLPAAQKSTGYSGLGAESLSPEEIAKYAAPSLAPEVSRRIQAMLDVRGAGSGLITTKGDRMYYTSSVTGSPQVWRQDGPLKFPIQLTGGEDRTSVSGLAPDDAFLVISRDVG